MPHGHCYLWKPELVWLHAISDSVIFIAYLMIPIGLSYIFYKSKYRLPFHPLLILFPLFILACGSTHFIEMINIWKSEYFLSGIIKAFTAIISIATAFALIPFVPKIVRIINELNVDKTRQ